MDRKKNVSCYLCCRPSVGVCVNCNDRFCLAHFNEHFQKLEEQFQNSQSSVDFIFEKFQHLEENLRNKIDQWERTKINQIKQTTFRVNENLQNFLQTLRKHFEKEFRQINLSRDDQNHDSRINSFESLLIQYERSLKDIRLADGDSLELQPRHLSFEEIDFQTSNPTSHEESNEYVPQTNIGRRLMGQPFCQVQVGSYWAIGASDQFLLCQEYQGQTLTIFDTEGQRSRSVQWHPDDVIRDIQWHRELKKFFVLLDKKLFLFEPISCEIEEIEDIRPFHSNLFRRLALNDDRILLSYWGLESSIDFIRINNWTVEKRWQSPITCNVNETITALRAKSPEQQIGLSIQAENDPLNRRFRFEIRDFQMKTLFVLPLHVDSGIFSRMVVFPQHWLLINVDESWIFILNERAELVDRICSPHGPLSNVDAFETKVLVLRTNDKLVFFDIQNE